MNDYEAKLEAKRERLRQAAKKADARADAAWKQMDQIACVIPLGQPILVGHHSEKRHRRDLKKMDRSMRKSVEERKTAAELERRADAIGTAGISSDDPDAIVKLKIKLASHERERDAIKAHNASARKAGAKRGDDRLVPGWKLTNLGATIRSTKQRIEQLEKEHARRASAPDPVAQTFGDVTVTEYPELNRVAIKFPAKPDADVLARLRSEGWHFNRRGDLAMCWTRMLNDAGRRSVRYVLALDRGVAPTPTPTMRDEHIEIDGEMMRACICETPQPRFSAAELAGELPGQGKPPPSQYCDGCWRPMKESVTS